MQGWRRQSLRAAAAVLATSLAWQSPATAEDENVLRVIPHADLKVLDPIWTTAYISRNHGYLIYDTLFAMDENFEPQPQMVDSWTASDDGLEWTFTLRDGLAFHDGAPVTSADVIASLERWGAKDGMGQQLMAAMNEMIAVDDKTFQFKLNAPFGLVLESIGKISSNVPFIMPARIAATSPDEQVPEQIGSGPFKFEADEWVPGSTVVYTKNEDYVPRDEPPSAAAGGKVAKVDKIIWTYFPDQTTAMNALMAGEVDYFESPSNDLMPILSSADGVVVEINDPLGNIGFARFNHLLPPFDDVEVRQAAIMAMKQEDYLAGAIGDPEFWKTCYSVYPCGTPLESEIGADNIKKGSIDEAKTALSATSYDGTPVVIMQPTDVPVLSAFSLITAEKLRNVGFEVDVQAMDWSTLVSRRAKRDPVSDGGWNMFHTWWIGADVIDPLANAFSGNPEKGWFGWADDQELETLRADFALATSPEDKKALGEKVQERLWDIGASGQLGQFFVPVAYRDNVKGLIKSPVQFFWNMSVE